MSDGDLSRTFLRTRKMLKVVQVSIGRFHHFHLARQLERHGLLEEIWTGYPRSSLRDEKGIPESKIKSFPYVQGPYMALQRANLSQWRTLEKNLAWIAHKTLDFRVAKALKQPGILLGLSGSGLTSGKRMHDLGGYYVCDRGSSHICQQRQLLQEEYVRWGLRFPDLDQRVIRKELEEYAEADVITVPSEFVRESFVLQGVDPAKLVKIPYGARIDRFRKVADPPENMFRVLWVGAVSVRKAFLDALLAFQKIPHSRKEFVVIGSIEPALQRILNGMDLNNVNFVGPKKNSDLPGYYSASHVFVIPSIEEGLAMVQAEAMACGCPVIASSHTGAADLFQDGCEGYIVPIRSPDAIAEKMITLLEHPQLRATLSNNAICATRRVGGWDTYGDRMAELLQSFSDR